MPTNSESLELYRRGWDEEDADLIASAITDDFELHDPWGSFHGVAKMRQYCETTYRRFRDIRTVYTEVIDGGSVVGIEWVMSLTGDIEGIDGKVVNLIGGAIVRMEDGRIRSWHDYWDSAQMSRALGLESARDLQG